MKALGLTLAGLNAKTGAGCGTGGAGGGIGGFPPPPPPGGPPPGGPPPPPGGFGFWFPLPPVGVVAMVALATGLRAAAAKVPVVCLTVVLCPVLDMVDLPDRS